MCNLKNQEISKLLPHTYPFLLVDRIVKYKKNCNISTIKNISYSEFCFTGHFVCNPIFPGVLILESIAQTASLLMYKSFDFSYKEKCFYLTNVDHAKFKKKVVPGDQMLISVVINRRCRKLIRFSGSVLVEKHVVCTATISCILKDVIVV